ncbi:uncharacterized protein LOC129616832 [Condylostylus longicornis]|uniref:uncharacterized protein LOC129616832 n=1 Tax=Condylostylus longicornis TaxID=2530218 RepID=UPI00244DE760|nr:uncharacterized protein LOC129616832 [Condylostylus longicornis]
MSMKKKDDYIPIKCEGWNGKFEFEPGCVTDAGQVARVRRYNQSITDPRNFFAFQTKATQLPPKWDGTFVGSKQEAIQSHNQCGAANRNMSSGWDIHGYSNETIILPTNWDGTFQTDSNDVTIKPERNRSDNRNYIE